MPLLNTGDKFPALTAQLPGGDSIQLPDQLSGHYGVVLLFRGAWCPYCNAQLRAFQRSGDKPAELDVRVVALSTEDESTTRELIAKHGLEFPVGHSVDLHQIHEATGAFVNYEGGHLQSTGFVLSPQGTVVVGVYSTGAIGRLLPEDVAGLIRHHREHAPTPRTER